ncbi:MAG: GFA family protein [Pigmentiphaga sp.]
MTQSTEGSCLCAAVRFRIEGAFESFFLCHCGRCRKDTGSAHGANLFSSTARLEWLAGERLVRTYRLPDTRHEKSFCGTCGSSLPRVQEGVGMLVVPAGSLDDTIEVRPNAHIFVAHRATWDEDLGSLPMIKTFPG